MRTRKGIYYFPSYQTARTYAEQHGHPTDRIIPYQVGWAIQLRVSGPYVGPAATKEAEVIADRLHEMDVWTR